MGASRRRGASGLRGGDHRVSGGVTVEGLRDLDGVRIHVAEQGDVHVPDDVDEADHLAVQLDPEAFGSDAAHLGARGRGGRDLRCGDGHLMPLVLCPPLCGEATPAVRLKVGRRRRARQGLDGDGFAGRRGGLG